MKNRRKLLVVVIVSGLLMVLATPVVQGGEGIYTEGTPDKLTLNAVFMYNETDFNPNTAWEGAFTRASQLLYNATEGQVQIGTVNLYNNCPEVHNKADVMINSGSGGASAHVGGLGTNGLHVYVYNDTHTQNVATARGQFGIVHEFGHYVFALYDEYKDTAGNSTSCISPTSTIASIMDGGTTVQPNNQRTEWSIPAYQANCSNTAQFQKRGMTCWPWIEDYVKKEYGATLTAPTAYDQSMPAGHQALTFNYYDCKVRAVVCLDRSGSMSGDKMTTAKAGGRLFVDLTRDTDELGVSSYADSPSVNYNIALMAAANKTAAKTAIDALSVTGSTNIGGGLLTSLTMITGQGDPVSNEVIILLSDGQHNTGTHPNDVIPALQARGVTVYTIGLGAGADAALMSSIASQTGGNYYFAAGTAGLQAHFNSIFTDMRNDGMITKLSEDIAAGGTNTHTAYVDAYTTVAGETTFVLSWTSGDLDLTLKRPDGTVVGDSDADVTMHMKDTQSELYRMSNPATGDWTMVVTSNVQTSYDLQVSSVSSSNVSVATTTDKESYTTAERILVQTSVQ
ncbi:MAG: VWA domain-containing protein, partial [Candidatus Eisenbacteria sp.]|nr:VWA domain-containing protein [Candidatus Eisenbacteria bacterium]